MSKSSFTVLGNAAAHPVPNRFSTCCFYKAEHFEILFDCGEGSQTLFQKYKVKPFQVDLICITHMHGDHVLGLIGLLTSLSLFGRTKALTIIGPATLELFIQHQLSCLGSVLRFKVDYIHVKTDTKQKIFENKIIELFAFPLNHRIETFGYMVVEKQKPLNIIKESIEQYKMNYQQIRAIKEGQDLLLEDGSIVKNEKLTLPPKKVFSLAFCTDTQYHPPLIEWIKGVGMLYHESTFLKKDQATANSTGHSTTTDAATIALKAGVEKLILGHFSNRYTDLGIFFEEANQLCSNTAIYKLGEKIFLD